MIYFEVCAENEVKFRDLSCKFARDSVHAPHTVVALWTCNFRASAINSIGDGEKESSSGVSNWFKCILEIEVRKVKIKSDSWHNPRYRPDRYLNIIWYCTTPKSLGVVHKYTV
jgi:hypothetical protein